MEFLKYKKIFYIISGILIFSSVFSIFYFGLNMGIEFEGGSVMEIRYQEDRPSTSEIREKLSEVGLRESLVQPTDKNGFVIRTEEISEETYKELKGILGENAEEQYFESIGPVIGQELRQKSIISVFLASLAIILYITLTFAGVGDKTVKSWQYGVVAAGIGFFHDVLIVLGIFSILGYFYGIQITIPIAVALLTVLGYSINDTVVIFDRIRENLTKKARSGFEEIINVSLNETLARSVSTSLTTIFVLTSILFLGGETLRWFIVALMVGVFLGTYSSIFLAGPFLSSWFNLKK